MGVPGCPAFAASTASMASALTVWIVRSASAPSVWVSGRSTIVSGLTRAPPPASAARPAGAGILEPRDPHPVRGGRGASGALLEDQAHLDTSPVLHLDLGGSGERSVARLDLRLARVDPPERAPTVAVRVRVEPRRPGRERAV